MTEGRPRVDLMQALKHPLRVSIFQHFISNTARPIDAGQLTEALKACHPDVQRGQVAYHLTILQEADLIPMS